VESHAGHAPEAHQPEAAHSADAPAPAELAVAVPAGAQHEGTRIALAHIDTAAAAGRARVHAQIEHGAQHIAAATATQHAAVKAAGVAQKARVGETFARARSDVAAGATQAQATVGAHAATQGAALTAWHAETVAATGATFTRGQARAQKAGDDGAQKATAAANTSAAQIDGKISGYAQQARAVGAQKAAVGGSSPEAADAKAKAASKISGDAADKITHLGDASDELRGMAPGTADGLRQKGQQAAQTIATGSPQVIAQYGAVHASSAQAMTTVAGKGRQSLDQHKTQVTASLHGQEQRTQASVDAQTAKSAGAISAAGAQAATAYRKQGAETVRAGDQAVRELKHKLAAEPLPAQHGTAIGTQAATELQRGFDGVATKAQAPVDQVTSHVGAAGNQAVGALGRVHGQVQAPVGAAVGQAHSSATALVGDVGNKLAGAVTGARGAGAQMQAKLDAGIGDQVGQVDSAVGKGVGDLQTSLDAKVAEADQKGQQPLAQVGPKIDEAHAKIESDAHKSTLDKALSWIGDQLSQLGKMLSDPGFWVGLLVAVVVIALLPEELAGLALIGAMAAVGALAAGIGTIVSNLAAGRPAFDNVLQNMLIGAVFGAGLTVVAAALGTGLVGIAGMMVTSGVLTVITNLVTGKPWDEGLLANVLLVGVFAGIAKLFGRPGGLKPAREPKPGEVLEPEPEPLPRPKNAAGLPPELQGIYDALTAKAQAQFDARWSRIARDPANPSPVEITRMKAYLDAAKAKGGDYSKGLEADWDKAHPEPGKAAGEAADQVSGLRAKAEALRARIEAARDAAPKGTGYESLLKALNGEIDGPLARLDHGEVEATNQAVQDVRSNIEGVEAQFQAAQAEKGVVGVGKEKQGGGKTADVDVEAGNGSRWVEVKNTEPFGLESSDWVGKPGKQGLSAQVDKLIGVSRDPANAVDGKPPEIVVRFPKGVSPEVAAALRAKGVKVIGTERPPVPPPPGDKKDKDHD
jgi:hypothetical protein